MKNLLTEKFNKYASIYFYFIFAFALFTKNFFRLTAELEHIQNICWAICYFFLALLFILQVTHQLILLKNGQNTNLSIEKLIPILAVLLFCACSYFGNSNREWFVMGFLALLSWVASQKALLLEALIIHSFVLISSPLLLFAGIVPDVSKPVQGMENHSLGLTHPNALGFSAFIIIVLIWIYFSETRSYDKSLKSMTILTCVSFPFLWIIYSISLCRTAILCSLFFFILAWTHFFFERSHKAIKTRNAYKFFIFVPVLCVIITFILGIIFENLSFSSTFTGRFVEIFTVIQTDGITLFGSPTDTFWIDNAYACFLFRGGVLLLISYVIVLTLSYRRVIRNNAWTYLVLFLSVQIYAFMESAQLIWTLMILQFTYLFSNK